MKSEGLRVLYFALQPGWSMHLVHELELMEADLARGAEIHVVPPGRTLRFSDTFPWGDFRERVDRDLARLSYGLSLLSGPVTVHALDGLLERCPEHDEIDGADWPTPNTHEELDRFAFGAHDCGNAVLSSLISLTRDTAVDLAAHSDWVRNALDSSVRVYLAAKQAIREVAPQHVYAFNGRMASFRGVLRACEELGVPCSVHERGATLGRVGTWPNAMPHDIYAVEREIARAWEESELSWSEKCQIGRTFFEQKRAGKRFNWKVFTAGQVRDALPERARTARRVYALFTSSEHERFALPQFYRYLFHRSQLEGIIDVVKILEAGAFDGLLCIRLHPNSHDEKPDLAAGLRRELDVPFVEIIEPTSPVDTYALLDASEKVVSFGTTLGMEAAYWETPSVSLATSAYANLDAVYLPRDREEMRRMLLAPLEPRDSLDTLKYGYYYGTFGTELRHAKVRGVSSLTFKGRKIRSAEKAGRITRARWRRRLAGRLRGDVESLPAP